jgi:hypothetical protein
MKTTFSPLLLSVLLLAGCATGSVETRRQERMTAYTALTPEQKDAVDHGKIKVGMSMDAVYIAWGKPSQILTSESSEGSTVTWLYHGTYLEEHRYWTYRGYYHRDRYYTSPHLSYDYYPRGYISAEVQFACGLVKEWRSLPQPGY